MERSSAPWYLPIVNHRGVVPPAPSGLSSALEQYCWYTEPTSSGLRDDGCWESVYVDDGLRIVCSRDGIRQVYSIEDL